MKIRRKLTVALLVLLSAILALCGALSLGRASEGRRGVATYAAEETGSWYQLSYQSDRVTLLIDGNYRSYLETNREELTRLGKGLLSAMREVLLRGMLENGAKHAVMMARRAMRSPQAICCPAISKTSAPLSGTSRIGSRSSM